MNNIFAVGAAIDFEGVKLPFSVSDLVSSGSALLGLVGTFVLLGLAFMLAPKLIRLIRQAFASNGRGN